jgi:hypothetical protein
VIGRYRYCGVTLSSALPLPELSELPALPLTSTTHEGVDAAEAVADAVPSQHPERPAEIQIRFDAVAQTLPSEQRRTATFAHNGREALWWLDGIGRFLVSADGRQVQVDPAPDADPAALRLMLLQPVMALASLRRGDWMLQAAAVERDGQVTAFIGPSASGKSTAAALLLQRGFRLVSDGLLRLTRAPDGTYLAHPQAPWLQVWPDAVKQLGLDDAALTPVRPGLRLQRWSCPAVTEALPLARIGLLREQRGNDLEDFVPSQRAGTRGVETLLAHTAGNTWLEELADRRALFHWAVGLKASVPLERLEVPWGWQRLEALGEQLAAWCTAATGGSPQA